jgi:hypothetical protein
VSSSEEDAVAEEFEAGAPEHLPFDHFRLVVDAFRSPVVVREGDCGGGGLDVEVEAAGGAVQQAGALAAQVMNLLPPLARRPGPLALLQRGPVGPAGGMSCDFLRGGLA